MYEFDENLVLKENREIMIGACKIYITPEDVYNKLSDKDKERFNKVIFINQYREGDGTVSIECVLVNDLNENEFDFNNKRRYRIFAEETESIF